MRISTSIQTVAALDATARHIDGTYGRFSILTLTICTTEGHEFGYDLFLPASARQAEVAEIYARHINAAAMEAGALTAAPVETVEEAA